jgi:hypothetical protein
VVSRERVFLKPLRKRKLPHDAARDGEVNELGAVLDAERFHPFDDPLGPRRGTLRKSEPRPPARLELPAQGRGGKITPQPRCAHAENGPPYHGLDAPFADRWHAA